MQELQHHEIESTMLRVRSMPTLRRSALVQNGEPRTRTGLLLEAVALRYQNRQAGSQPTRRPCFRFWDRLFWILLLRWWPQWHDSLIIAQPETVLRWRRNGWSTIWGYRIRGRCRGGVRRVSSEVRHLITQPPYRVTCLHQALGPHNRGGFFFAIKAERSASTPEQLSKGHARPQLQITKKSVRTRF
jgi:hypothetical protein